MNCQSFKNTLLQFAFLHEGHKYLKSRKKLTIYSRVGEARLVNIGEVLKYILKEAWNHFI